MSEVESYSRLAAVYDEMVVDDAYPHWAEFLDDLWQADESGVRNVLDVCCGTGLMGAELARLGYRVVGIDSSAEMLQRARHLLGPNAELSLVTLPDLPTTETFDAVISTFDGLNYVPPRDFARTLSGLARIVRPGGWLCFDLHTDTMMEFTIANPMVEGEADGKAYLISSRVDAGRRECVTSITVTQLSDGATFSEQHQQYFHSTDAVQHALSEAGFRTVAVVDEYSAVPFDPETMRATWIARRA